MAACKKKCPVCNELRPHEDYHKNRSRYDGLDWRCKFCKGKLEKATNRRRRDARRYQKDKGKVLARARARKTYAGKIYVCSVVTCGNNSDEFHHIDYSFALDVIPLCKKHHRMLHDN